MPWIKGVRGEKAAEEKKAEKDNKENETKNTQHTHAQGLLGVAENYSYPVKLTTALSRGL